MHSPGYGQSSTSNQQAQTSNSGTFPTPPSTAGFQNPMAGRGAGSDAGGESERQTPASDYEGISRKDGDGDAEMVDGVDDGPMKDVPMADAEHRRTDHERQRGRKGCSAADQPRLGLFKLSTAHVPRSQPHPSQNLVELYDLGRIQKSVARRDPVTGEKINKLRKSYESKVKNLGLEGRNKAQAAPGLIEGLIDQAWENPTGDGRTWWQAQYEENTLLTDPNAQNELFSKLDSAFDLAPGQLPAKEHKDWHNQLGLDDVLATAASGGRTPLGTVKAPAAAPSAIAKTAPAVAARSSAPSSPRNIPGRPERSGKKRRYDDNSFEGYTGYGDDDGYSTGGADDLGRRGSNAKRQKRKDFGPGAQNSPAFNAPSSNNGVGVRSS